MRMLLITVCSLLFSACKSPTNKVEVIVSGGGEVVSEPAGIYCGNGNTKCSTEFGGDIDVKLIARPQYLEYFEGWDGSCSEGGECIVASAQGAKVKAKFTDSLVLSTSTHVPAVLPILSYSLMNTSPGSVALRWRDPEDGRRSEVVNGAGYKKTYEIYASLDAATLFTSSSLVASVDNDEVKVESEARANDPRCDRRPPRTNSKEVQGWGVYFNPLNLTCSKGLSGSRNKGNFRNEQERDPNPKAPDEVELQETISLCHNTCTVVGDPERFYVIDNLMENHRYYFGIVLIDRFGNRSSSIEMGNIFVGDGFSIKQEIVFVDAVDEAFLSKRFSGQGGSLRYVLQSTKNLAEVGNYIAVTGQDGYMEVFYVTNVSFSSDIYTYTTRHTRFNEWLEGDVVVKGSGYPAMISNSNDKFQPKEGSYRAKSSSSVHVDCDAKGRAVMTRTDDPEWDQSPSFDYCIPLSSDNATGCDDGGNELPRVVLSGNLRKKIGLAFDFQDGRCARREFEIFGTKQKRFSLGRVKVGGTNRLAKFLSLQASFGVDLEVEAETKGSAKAQTDLLFSIEGINISMRTSTNGISTSIPKINVTPIFKSQLESYYTYRASIIPRITITKDLVWDEVTFDLKYQYNFLGEVRAQEISRIANAGVGLAQFDMDLTQGCAIDWAKDGAIKDISEIFNIDVEYESRKCQEIGARNPVNLYKLPARLSFTNISTGSSFNYAVSKGNGFIFDPTSLRLGAYLGTGQNLIRHDALWPASQINSGAIRVDYQVPSMPDWNAMFEQSTKAAKVYQLYERAATAPLVLDDGSRIPGLPIILNSNHQPVQVVPEEPPARRCGSPISAAGGFADKPQVFEIDMGQIAGKAQFEFEAYRIPDKYTIKSKSNNTVLHQSNNYQSGFHANSFSFNPKSHGERVQLIVETNDDQTAWAFIVGCPGETLEPSQKPIEPIVLTVAIGRSEPGATNSCKLDFWLNDVLQYSGPQQSLHRFAVRTHSGASGGRAAFRYVTSGCTTGFHPFGSWDTSSVQYGAEIVPLNGSQGTFIMNALR